MGIEYNLKQIERATENIKKTLNETENYKIELIDDLVKACEVIDNVYYEMCGVYDIEDGLSQDTTYNEGVSIEFYIEAEWWHEVSIALRKLKELNDDNEK